MRQVHWVDGGRIGSWDVRKAGALARWVLSEEVPFRVPALGISHRYRRLRPAWVLLAGMLGWSYERTDPSQMLFVSGPLSGA